MSFEFQLHFRAKDGYRYCRMSSIALDKKTTRRPAAIPDSGSGWHLCRRRKRENRARPRGLDASHCPKG